MKTERELLDQYGFKDDKDVVQAMYDLLGREQIVDLFWRLFSDSGGTEEATELYEEILKHCFDARNKAQTGKTAKVIAHCLDIELFPPSDFVPPPYALYR